MKTPHVLLFEPYSGGHHGHYVRLLVEHWVARAIPGRLTVAVAPPFPDIHTDVIALLDDSAGQGVDYRIAGEAPALRLERSARDMAHNQRVHGRALRRLLLENRPDHCLCLYFDHLQLPLATGLRFSFDVRISGIYFRPSFHYASLTGRARTVRDRFVDLRKRLLLRAALANPHVSHVFSLDPTAVGAIKTLGHGVRVVPLPDGVPLPVTKAAPSLRTVYQVDASRRVALVFGSLAERKGIFTTLEAVERLREEDQMGLCVAFIGSLAESDRERFESALTRCRSNTAAQIVVDDRFVDDGEIDGLVGAADLVLLPYQRHVGSSGVLIRAAAAKRPVLASDYGLVGEQTRRHRLGRAVDATDQIALMGAISDWLHEPDGVGFDPEEARAFAEANAAPRFASTIFDALLS